MHQMVLGRRSNNVIVNLDSIERTDVLRMNLDLACLLGWVIVVVAA